VTENPLAFLSLVKLLESAVGYKTKYEQLEPFPCSIMQDGKPAIIPIQNAGKIIAHHAGLNDFIFIISVTTQKPTTAGHIELRYGSRDVYVEVSRHICGHKDAVLATLCHEIAHKFLHEHAIRNGITQLEQELLTDVATVYLGMGKIMLNGCECEKVEWKSMGSKTTKTIHTLKIGYISRECFAFVYRLVCEMQQIPRKQFLAGLSEPARRAVLRCEKEFASWFQSEYHSLDGQERLLGDLNREVVDCQDRSAQGSLILRQTDQALRFIGASLDQSHQSLFQAQAKIATSLEHNDNPHLRYLSLLEIREIVIKFAAQNRSELDGITSKWEKMKPIYEGETQLAKDNGWETVECPIDRTKLRIPGGKRRLLVTCPSCSYKFIVKTSNELGEATRKAPKKRRFWRFGL
jgi:hypothetical protein